MKGKPGEEEREEEMEGEEEEEEEEEEEGGSPTSLFPGYEKGMKRHIESLGQEMEPRTRLAWHTGYHSRRKKKAEMRN